MSKNFRETLNKELKNPEFKKEWDSLEPEYQIVKAILESRKENGSGNPSLKTLKRLAEGMGKTLEIKFL